jgi:periplasmic protein TonB
MLKEDENPPMSGMGGVVGGVPGGVPGGQMGGVIGGIINSTPVAVPKVATPQRVRVSAGVSQGLLIHQVKPSYPALARQARIQGGVVLQAVIGKDGSIQNLRAVSGHPMLTPAAIDAVKQWRYKPYYLNGEPVEVDTQITVNFTLAGG